MAKNKVIQVRVSDEELRIIQANLQESGMSQSEYMRSALLDTPIYQKGYQREIMQTACEMFSILNQMGETEGVYKLREKVSIICQYLR